MELTLHSTNRFCADLMQHEEWRRRHSIHSCLLLLKIIQRIFIIIIISSLCDWIGWLYEYTFFWRAECCETNRGYYSPHWWRSVIRRLPFSIRKKIKFYFTCVVPFALAQCQTGMAPAPPPLLMDKVVWMMDEWMGGFPLLCISDVKKLN